MPDANDKRPTLIPPLVRSSEALELVRERPAKKHGPEHPHCEEHFLFTPHCAACLEAERTGYATATARLIDAAKPKAEVKAVLASSRSFGFHDNFPLSLVAEPPLAQELTVIAVCEVVDDLADLVIDDLFS